MAADTDEHIEEEEGERGMHSFDGQLLRRIAHYLKPYAGWVVLALVITLGASFLGPLLFLVLADDDDELVKRNAKNSLNFQIVVFIAMIVSGLLTAVLVGFLLLPLIGLLDLVLVVMATLKANEGQVYSYPYTPNIV